MWEQKEITIKNKNRGFHLITNEIIQNIPELKKFSIGLIHIFIKHTSASLTLNENTDQSVRSDLESHFNHMVPERQKYYSHESEGDDDMPAHIKSSLLGNSLIIPINNTIIGRNCIIHSSTTIGSDGFGYEFDGSTHQKIVHFGHVEIGKDVEIGANCTIDRGRFGKTLIGEGTKIDNLCQVGHNVIIGKHCIIVADTAIGGSSKIGDYVTMAAQVGIAGHIEVGAHSVLVARTGVTKSLPGGEPGNVAV